MAQRGISNAQFFNPGLDEEKLPQEGTFELVVSGPAHQRGPTVARKAGGPGGAAPDRLCGVSRPSKTGAHALSVTQHLPWARLPCCR